MVDPTVAVAAQLQALSLVLHCLGVRTLAVEKDPFEQLENRITYIQNTFEPDTDETSFFETDTRLRLSAAFTRDRD